MDISQHVARADHPTRSAQLMPFLSAAAVFLSAWGGIVLTRQTDGIALLWLSNAIAFATMLRSPRRAWAGIVISAALAIIIANAVSGNPLPLSLALTACHAVEMLVAAIGVRILIREGSIDVARPPVLAAVAAVAALLAPAASALLAAPILAVAVGVDPIRTGLTWFQADALGMIIVAPVLLSVHVKDFLALSLRQIGEAAVIVAAVIATSLLVFGQSRYPLLFLIPPVLLIAAFRLAFRGAALAVCASAAVAVGLTVSGRGPLMLVPAVGERILLLQAFLAILVFMTLAVATIVSQKAREMRRRAAAEAALQQTVTALQASETELMQSKAALEQRVAERTAELAHLVRDYEVLVQSAPVGVITTDRRGAIIQWNSAAERMLGPRRAEVHGRGGRDLPQDLHDLWPVFAGKTAEAATSSRLEVTRRARDGSRIDLIARPTRLSDSTGAFAGVLTIVADVTERRRVEEQLRQSQKMDAIGHLTGGIAHDFNNILTVILGMIDILTEDVTDDPELAVIARTIDGAATRGADLTRQLLAFARRQTLKPRETDVNALIRETTRLLGPTLGEPIEIETMLGEDAWRAMIDPAQLSAALLNLAVNARDAMPEGGKIVIETGNVILDEAYARTNSEVTPGPFVVVAVSDTGAGIPAALQAKVFDPFFTTKEPGKGTGLGLSMVYGFVKQSGGHIKLYSEDGVGTTIKLYLPRSEGQGARAEERPAEAMLEGGGETILVVEDDSMVLVHVVAQLKSLGYTTLAAGNAAQALALVDAGATFDLLFTDVIMRGGMNGRELAEEIARRRPAVPVLYTSGYTQNAIVHHGRLEPGVALLNKPYRKSDLARKIREALTPRAERA
jgi:PAS domain S-box-containing protein